MGALRTTALALGAAMIVATALPILRSGAWWIRWFDFPRQQVLVLAAASLALLLMQGNPASGWESALVALLAAAIAYQSYMMFPYTPLARRQVESAERPAEGNTVAIVFANVLMQNRQSARLLEIIRAEDPDVVLAVETDAWWQRELDALAQTHGYAVRQVQDNTYGMLLYSRLELVGPQVKFLVEDDVPSIHARLKLG